MRKKLIVSYDTYSWVKYISGMIIENPNLYEVVIVCRDEDRDMVYCPFLCEDAVYQQRRYDLFRIAKNIGLKKVSNLNYTYSGLIHNFDRFVAEISIMSLVAGVDTIIFHNQYILRNIMLNMKHIKTLAYGNNFGFENNKFIYLKKETIDKKIELSRFMFGIHDKQERKLFPSVEQLYF